MPTGANSSIVSPKLGSFGKNSREFEKKNSVRFCQKTENIQGKNSMKFQKTQFLTTIRICLKQKKKAQRKSLTISRSEA